MTIETDENPERSAKNADSPRPTPPPGDADSRVDAPIVARAYKKIMAREELSRDERIALKRHEREKEERLRWQYYRDIPQGHWREMCGRQSKVINEQAERYNLPFGGRTIDLPKLARRLHDFLAENALKLAKEDDPLLQGGPTSPALERYRDERAELSKLDRLERQEKLLPREQMRMSLGRISTIFRDAGDRLQRQFGPGALDILLEAMGDAEEEIDRSFGVLPPKDGAPVKSE